MTRGEVTAEMKPRDVEEKVRAVEGVFRKKWRVRVGMFGTALLFYRCNEIIFVTTLKIMVRE